MIMNQDATADLVAKKWLCQAVKMRHPFTVGYALHRDSKLKIWLDVIILEHDFDINDFSHIPLRCVKEAHELYQVTENPYFVVFCFTDGLWYVKVDVVRHEVAVINDNVYSLVPNTALTAFSRSPQ